MYVCFSHVDKTYRLLAVLSITLLLKFLGYCLKNFSATSDFL